jgi:hypothetical protein
MAKHIELEIADGRFTYRRRADAIAAEAALDGLYVVRNSVPSERLDAPAVVLERTGDVHAEPELHSFRAHQN